MKLARTSTTAGVIFAAVLIGTTVAGCGGDKDKDSKSDSSSSSSSSTSSSTAAETSSSAASTPAAEGTDYSALLIKASDIDPSFTDAGPPILNPNGVPGVGTGFINAGKNETIYDTIVVTDDAEAAAQGLEGLKSELPKKVTGAPQPADVGTGGTMATGTSPDGTKAITIVMFTEDRAVVNLELESAPGDIVQPGTAVAIAKMQEEAVAKGLAG